MIEYKNIKHKKPPLPFLGCKKDWLKILHKHVTENENRQHPKIIVDVFGGSGLLANFYKQLYPKAQVIWNDYDNYQNRLNQLPQTNNILCQLRGYVAKHTPEELYSRDTLHTDKPRFTDEHCEAIKGILESTPEYDWRTILPAISFRGSVKTSAYNKIYNAIPQKNYDASGYLDNVQIVRQDGMGLIEEYDKKEKVLFLLDPPYPVTYEANYEGRESTYLALKIIEFCYKTNNNFILFSSTNSTMEQLVRFYEEERKRPFYNSVLLKQSKRGLTKYHEYAFVKE